MYRVAWASSGELVVPVIDWEECTGGWKGTVTYAETTTISDETRVTTADGGVTNRKNTIRNGYTGTIDINNGTATATAAMSSTTRADEYSIRYGKCHSYDRVKPLLGQGYTIVQLAEVTPKRRRRSRRTTAASRRWDSRRSRRPADIRSTTHSPVGARILRRSQDLQRR